MDHHDNNHKSGNGFLAGLVVGGVATLLFTTKKGREIVKELTEKGLDKFSELQEKFEYETSELEELDGDDYIQPEPLGKKELNEIKKEAQTPTSNPQKKSVKRFFRRVKKG